MEDRFLQQLQKGVLEMLVLQTICEQPGYGYELLLRLRQRSGGLFTLKEGTLYPILYRLEDSGMIASGWLAPEGRAAPKKIYSATEQGLAESRRQRQLWCSFSRTVEQFYEGGSSDV